MSVSERLLSELKRCRQMADRAQRLLQLGAGKTAAERGQMARGFRRADPNGIAVVDLEACLFLDLLLG